MNYPYQNPSLPQKPNFYSVVLLSYTESDSPHWDLIMMKNVVLQHRKFYYSLSQVEVTMPLQHSILCFACNSLLDSPFLHTTFPSHAFTKTFLKPPPLYFFLSLNSLSPHVSNVNFPRTYSWLYPA